MVFPLPPIRHRFVCIFQIIFNDRKKRERQRKCTVEHRETV